MDIKQIERIKNVAIYLRKSRDEDGPDALEKHRTRLIEIADINGWKYGIYEEIGSSDTIEFRPHFKRLLDEIKLGLYDAVFVVHPDRLTRGDMYEYGLIKRIFQESETLIVTPDGEVIDYNEKGVIHDIRQSLVRYEYETIKERFKQGKISGAKKGYWTNGPAPYGYTYDRQSKKLNVNEEQAQIYRYIVEQYLDGKGIQRIAIDLRLMKTPSPRGSYWQEATIKRLLQNPAFLGKTVYLRTSGSLHKNKKTQKFKVNDEEQWLVVNDTHPALISQEEFDKVQYILSQNKRIPVAARGGKQVLSGLVFCAKCGAAMTFNERNNKKNVVVSLKTCQKYSPEGLKCGNPGINAYYILDIVQRELKKYEKQLKKHNNRKGEAKYASISKEISLKQKALQNQQHGFDRIKDMFRLGVIDRNELISETEKQKELIHQIDGEIRDLEKQLYYISNESNEVRLSRFEEFKTNFDLESLDKEAANKLLHSIVDKIHYSRSGSEIEVVVDFK